MKNKIWIIAVIAIIGLLILKLANNKKTTESKIYQYDSEKPISVSADTIRLQNINDLNVYTGIFEPNRETKVSSEIQGKINRVLVDPGSYVSKGQTLIQLDNSLLKLQLQTVEVQIQGLQDDVKRYTILSEADAVQGVQLEKASLGLKSAMVQRETLLEQIGKTAIKAPFNGVVTSKLNEEGGFAAPGVPLLQLTELSTLRFTINVPENELVQFQNNKYYQIKSDILPDIFLSGKVSMIGCKANVGNSFPIQFQVANTKNLGIKAGMFGKVNLYEAKQEQGILIPTSSIIEENGIAKVFLVKNGKALIQAITTSRIIGDKTLVSSGLKENDIIVTNGFINLFDNANIITK